MSSLSTESDAAHGAAMADDQGGVSDWWTDCSTAELKQILAQGLNAGDRFDIAAREVERRAIANRDRAEADAVDRRRDEVRAQRLKRIRLVGLVLVLAALFVLVDLFL